MAWAWQQNSAWRSLPSTHPGERREFPPPTSDPAQEMRVFPAQEGSSAHTYRSSPSESTLVCGEAGLWRCWKAAAEADGCPHSRSTLARLHPGLGWGWGLAELAGGACQLLRKLDHLQEGPQRGARDSAADVDSSAEGLTLHGDVV